ncbi:hypothetical protein PH552_12245 [Rhizobium sp. CNPSo 3968]|uniref:hypothetical protein n=1 Tax=Rhizobium sp. CNPSo 3968 TaxID=3021408 RepID=UPI00254E1106|nr:hypothetical protein [Rhizobium sp. CNPSo 3968]MDK4720115.1 hypothetical protein [Rhizobium sp. CNPSo 3968]
MFRIIRFLVVVYAVIVAVDYVRDNIPNWENFLKLPLPALPPNIADMLGDRAAEINKQADKLAKMAEDLANHPPPGLNFANPLSAAPPGPSPQDIQKKADEIQKLAKQLHLPSPQHPIPGL